MSIASHFLARLYDLPKRTGRARRPETEMVKMPDGISLSTEIHRPRKSGDYPTLLMRVPYGTKGFATVAEAYAERGFNVVLQACRGTGSSEGEFDPLTNERADGLATLAWLKAQPFYDGRLGTTGPSYLGYAQWAICDALPKGAAMATKVSSSEFRSVVFPGGAFHLGLWLGWLQTVEGLRKNPATIARRMFSGGIERRTQKASMTLPLIDADKRVVGREVGFWRRWMTEAIGNDAFWEDLDHTHRLGPRTPPNHFISGWYDFMVDQLLRDYETLTYSGHTPYLTIGNWYHVSNALQGASIRETLTWMRAHLLGEREGLRERPVRLEISGMNEWRDFDAYPPGPADDQIWHIHPDKVLSRRPVRASEPDRYRYDPRRPTPNLGGAIFAFTGAGPVDQKTLEARADVLVYTSEPLNVPLTVIGNVRVTLYARASIPNADFFVKLCDVSPDGISTNICDGFIRMTSAAPAVPDDIWRLQFKLHATAHCFKRDHSLRLQISSGAHPRYARNTGTDEPAGTTTTLVPSFMEIFHDPTRPTAISLPVYDLRE
ncbi:CocE/NonD family hydrolase [Arsenicitalea aurantiaca]|uniref:CocE/NonD family hydrolase n=1 Tax=Arsenicitalea aurantiaca TaxID=1783274 RepID=A0A433XLI2_9HYPH|nr:CocE/NonD family hydrolase [Arsenicitalea aurantiaca]RUT34935.1 CocE/NonD family hydrolase [Arsenicitalea aurantiaca]